MSYIHKKLESKTRWPYFVNRRLSCLRFSVARNSNLYFRCHM